jgi:hypothetical protein
VGSSRSVIERSERAVSRSWHNGSEKALAADAQTMTIGAQRGPDGSANATEGVKSNVVFCEVSGKLDAFIEVLMQQSRVPASAAAPIMGKARLAYSIFLASKIRSRVPLRHLQSRTHATCAWSSY